PGSWGDSIRRFMASPYYSWKLTKPQEVDLNQVTHLILVDTKLASRIGPFSQLIASNPALKIDIYDHHPPQPDDLKGEIEEVRPAGATVTILTRLIKERAIPLAANEATAMIMGICEDTGFFSFPTTTPEDLEAAAYLLRCGADLNLASHFLKEELTLEQFEFLNDLLRSSERYRIKGTEVVIAILYKDKYMSELGTVVQRFMDMLKIDIFFALVKIGTHSSLIARSRFKGVDVGAVAGEFGGGGHPSAASASLRAISLLEAREKLLSLLSEELSQMEEEVSAPAFSAVGEIITRNPSLPSSQNLTSPMKEQLPAELFAIIETISRTADGVPINAFLVGGFVRDLLLKIENVDLDVVVEGDGIQFARTLAQKVEGSSKGFPQFHTAVVMFPQGFKVDIASARTEFYEVPAALPVVQESSLRADLYRRDFTFNALAVRLNKPHFGELIDYFGGRRDLNEGIIRVLHNLSFIEDPTRLLRAIRFQQRFQFQMEGNTRKLLREAVEKGILNLLSGTRLMNELRLIFEEEHPAVAIQTMAEFDILKFIHPHITYDKTMGRISDNIEKVISWYNLLYREPEPKPWLIYLMGLFERLSTSERQEGAERLNLPPKERKTLTAYHEEITAIATKLRKRKEAKPSQIYSLLHRCRLEVLLYTMAKAEQEAVKQAISIYLRHLSQVRLNISGDDLLKLGCSPGPLFNKILRKILLAKLDGRVSTREEELEMAKKLIKSQLPPSC
ncbi:MAG: DHHA1 domain-containing protein, partial [Acidobacteriota bacterium]